MTMNWFPFGGRTDQPSAVASEPDPGLLEKCIERLDPKMRFFAESFYEKFNQILPEQYCLRFDSRAPDNPNLEDQKAIADRLSLEVSYQKEGAILKYGTGRVALRDRFYFAKTVTWNTPPAFLHRRNVYDLIKSHFCDCRIVPNRSITRKGFTIKNNHQLITIEVFGDNPLKGYLACDITLSRFNQPLAKQRMTAFMEFYGNLYNQSGNNELTFATKPASDVEFPEFQIFDEGLGSGSTWH